nr:unnamed protein product [Meloidogyne enterolobii]
MCVVNSQNAFKNPLVSQQIAYIQANFGTIVYAITRLETQGLSLIEATEIITEVSNALAGAAGNVGITMRQKWKQIIERTRDFRKLPKFSGQLLDDFDMPPNLISLFKYAPITSVDVERSFSVYKTILADNRTRFTPENLEMYLISNCEQNQMF